jgi:hypothetical protein
MFRSTVNACTVHVVALCTPLPVVVSSTLASDASVAEGTSVDTPVSV